MYLNHITYWRYHRNMKLWNFFDFPLNNNVFSLIQDWKVSFSLLKSTQSQGDCNRLVKFQELISAINFTFKSFKICWQHFSVERDSFLLIRFPVFPLLCSQFSLRLSQCNSSVIMLLNKYNVFTKFERRSAKWRRHFSYSIFYNVCW